MPRDITSAIWPFFQTLDVVMGKQPYHSFENGSAMRVFPVGFAYNTTDEVLEQSKRSAEVTHNHPEGIKGAQATALAVFMARHGTVKETIRKDTQGWFNYELNRIVESKKPP